MFASFLSRRNETQQPIKSAEVPQKSIRLAPSSYIAPKERLPTASRSPDAERQTVIVLTSHGGVLRIEPTTGKLLHLPCLLTSIETLLWEYDGSTIRPSPDLGARSELLWQVRDAGAGHVAFETEMETFVRASPHLGPISLDAPALDDWEHFMLLSVQDFLTISRVAASRWLIDNDPQPTEAPSLIFTEKFSVLFGGRAVALADLLLALRKPPSAIASSGLSMHFTFFHDLCTASRAFLFNPLIYTTICGSDHFFEQASMCLSSLTTHGRYTGSYRLISDRNRADLAPFFDSIEDHRWDNIKWPMVNVTELVSARMTVLESPEFEGFQPVLYLDCDIVCDGPIEALLVEAVRSSQILVATEFSSLSIKEVGSPHGNWFGEFLYTNDDRVSTHKCVNNGIFAARNRHVFLEPFSIVAQSWKRYKNFFPDRHLAAYDQPFYSYVLQCLDNLDILTMNKWVQNIQGREPTKSFQSLGLAHFNIGMGLDKTQAMKRYLKMLDHRSGSVTSEFK